MSQSYAPILAAWAAHRREASPLPLHELLDCVADRPELVRHARWLAALDNAVATLMQIEPDESDTIH